MQFVLFCILCLNYELLFIYWRKRSIALVMFTDSLTNTSPDGVSALQKPLRDGGKKSVCSNESGAGGLLGL